MTAFLAAFRQRHRYGQPSKVTREKSKASGFKPDDVPRRVFKATHHQDFPYNQLRNTSAADTSAREAASPTGMSPLQPASLSPHKPNVNRVQYTLSSHLVIFTSTIHQCLLKASQPAMAMPKEKKKCIMPCHTSTENRPLSTEKKRGLAFHQRT